MPTFGGKNKPPLVWLTTAQAKTRVFVFHVHGEICRARRCIFETQIEPPVSQVSCEFYFCGSPYELVLSLKKGSLNKRDEPGNFYDVCR